MKVGEEDNEKKGRGKRMDVLVITNALASFTFEALLRVQNEKV